MKSGPLGQGFESIFLGLENHEMNSELNKIASMIFGEDELEYILLSMQEYEYGISKILADRSGKELKRIEAAILKLCEFNPGKFEDVMELAKTDYRDLLVGSGFGHDVDIHEKWIEGKIKTAEQQHDSTR